MSVFSVTYLRNHTPTPTRGNAPKQTHPASKSVTSFTSSISKSEAPRTRKMTGKGKAYQLGIKQANLDCALARLKKQIEKINLMRDLPETKIEQLASETDYLDRLKDEFNDAQKAYDDLLESPEEKDASYQWFDIRDREFTECRIRICERIQALEKISTRPPSEKSRHSRKSSVRSSRSSSSHRISLALVDAAAKAAKLRAEMELFDKEREIRRLQLEKEIAIANAEEDAIKRIIDEDKLSIKEENKSVKQDIDPGTRAEKFIKNERDFPMDPNVPSFVPSNLPEYPEILRPEPFFSSSQYVSPDISATMREIVNLQAKQAELSSMIINQQKTTHLPVKEPPIFSGDPFEYPAFITAFDSIISANVPSDRDRLFFLNKYTKDKANEVVKGFLAMSSDSAYKEARKLLDHRFGNPVHVAEAYKSSLRKWPQISDGNSSGLQEFSDFLVRCEEAMKTMNSMGDLDSTQTLLQISAKLPSYSGVKWCRQAHEAQTKTKKIITFSDFVKFVKEEAELANDPIFSPDALKKERNKTVTVNQPRFGRKIRPKSKGVDGASGTSLATGGLPMESKIASEKSYQPCPLCEGQHSLVKCSSFLKKSVDQRSDVIREKGLCYGCFKRGHMSAGCRDRFTCEENGRRHHTLLHGVKPKSSNPQPHTKEELSVLQPKKNEPQRKPVVKASQLPNHQIQTRLARHTAQSQAMQA